MKEKISIAFPVRTQSERCPNKCLRDFYQGKSITEIAAEKFSGRDDVYIAANDDSFKAIADKHNVHYVERSEKSVYGETVRDVATYIWDLPGGYVCVVNVCTPFLKAETIDQALEAFRESQADTLLPVVETHDIFFDSDKRPVNKDAHIFNSKLRKPLYQVCNGFIIFSKANVEKHGTYFQSYEQGDPMLFPMSYKESLDIDTEEQFDIVQGIYEKSR